MLQLLYSRESTLEANGKRWVVLRQVWIGFDQEEVPFPHQGSNTRPSSLQKIVTTAPVLVIITLNNSENIKYYFEL
jgi:hypothetical protein